MKNSTAYEPQSYDIYMTIAAEVEKDYQRYGLDDKSGYVWFTYLLEEIGTMAAELNETEESLDEQICKVASVCVRWLNQRKRDEENEDRE